MHFILDYNVTVFAAQGELESERVSRRSARYSQGMSVHHPDVDRWFETLERPWQREVSLTLRRLIFEAVPEMEEAYHWSTPAYSFHGPVCWYNVARDWVNLSFPHGALLEVPPGFWDEGPDTRKVGKRTLKILEGAKVPEEAMTVLVAQAAENNRRGHKIALGGKSASAASFVLPPAWQTVLTAAGTLDAYLARPPYQKQGWIRWIEAARTPETRQKRTALMLEELVTGQYMQTKAERRKGKP